MLDDADRILLRLVVVLAVVVVDAVVDPEGGRADPEELGDVADLAVEAFAVVAGRVLVLPPASGK